MKTIFRFGRDVGAAGSELLGFFIPSSHGKCRSPGRLVVTGMVSFIIIQPKSCGLEPQQSRASGGQTFGKLPKLVAAIDPVVVKQSFQGR